MDDSREPTWGGTGTSSRPPTKQEEKSGLVLYTFPSVGSLSCRRHATASARQASSSTPFTKTNRDLGTEAQQQRMVFLPTRGQRNTRWFENEPLTLPSKTGHVPTHVQTKTKKRFFGLTSVTQIRAKTGPDLPVRICLNLVVPERCFMLPSLFLGVPFRPLVHAKSISKTLSLIERALLQSRP